MVLLQPTVFSAIQPSGKLTLGNYIGALSHWVRLQRNNHCIYGIADLHALTTVQNSSYLLKKNKLDTLSFYLAAGIDPNKSIIFAQSDVYEHCQLYWILNCYTYFGELSRMTQFKSKVLQYSKNINSGLLNYPILMSSDILLYYSDRILIGYDQKQHLELTKNIAFRFNYVYGNILRIPHVYIPNIYSSKIMALLNPKKKMSKSDINFNNVIFLLEDKKSIFYKVSRSVTDSENKIYYDMVHKPGISNLLNIFSSLTGIKISVLESDFANMLYQEFKILVAEKIESILSKLRDRFFYYRNNESYLFEILERGAHQARIKAKRTIDKVYNVLGL
ncbi:tryptophan--tRNA ligase [Buchnera aphidicola]|uniref:Tryptophan--tRNA ligase n=1 Tax=Buchnera aphidicola (Stegophylla sp.) TaxID=2315800 RepID=A0A4D6YKJ1_9GAMM|nr:tryptophan--tRNA ligase [Buchnera aphidicola (Stegophylla sp.)]QCI26494.1 tryptophan--tRNA ligase [Buchnera aphidicola (Stegophylla sp.)]